MTSKVMAYWHKNYMHITEFLYHRDLAQVHICSARRLPVLTRGGIASKKLNNTIE
jgi:hypothetical protein